MNQLSERVDIPILEWRRVTIIAWSTLSAIFAIQALLSEFPVKAWQIFYLLGLASAFLLSLALSRIERFTFSSTPVVAYLLFSPIFIGDLPKSPWMSIGLVTFAAVIYYATIENFKVALLVVSLISIYQTVIVQFALKSISDNSDIAYFHSYFSFVYILVFGIASIYIRHRYLGVANSVQEIVEEELEKAVIKLEDLKKINEKDSKSLRLHGTVLNTLIHLRNLIIQGQESTLIQQTLEKEILELKSVADENYKQSFKFKLENVLTSRSLNRIRVDYSSFEGNLESEFLENSCLEIVRELILNSEKHTNAVSGVLAVRLRSNKDIQITLHINEIGNSQSATAKNSMYSNPSSSKTLGKLLKTCNGDLDFSIEPEKGTSVTKIRIPLVDQTAALQQTLSSARTHGLNDFTLNYVRAGALVAILSLPGYLLIDLNVPTLLLTTILIFSLIAALQLQKRNLVIAILVISSLLIIPAASLDVTSCSRVLALPWIFNHILTVCFFIAVQINGRVIKWIPTAIFSAECFLLPLNYPASCKNIFLGSLPGIPLIIVLAFAVLGVRKREFVFDEEDAITISESAIKSSEVDSYREKSFEILLLDCHVSVLKIKNESSDELRLKHISLLIQMIQTYLVCSEFFDSRLIRDAFELFRELQTEGIPGRLSLLGGNFSTFDHEQQNEEIIAGLKRIKGTSPVNISLVNLDSLEIHIDGAESLIREDHIAGIPVYVQS